MSSTTPENFLLKFWNVFVKAFGDEYLRAPNKSDMERILNDSERLGAAGATRQY